MHKSSDTCANSIDRSVHYSVSMLMRYVYSCTTAHEHVNEGAGRAKEANMSRRTCRDVRATLDHPRGDARGRLQRASNIFERSLPRTCLDMCSPTYQETHAQSVRTREMHKTEQIITPNMSTNVSTNVSTHVSTNVSTNVSTKWSCLAL